MTEWELLWGMVWRLLLGPPLAGLLLIVVLVPVIAVLEMLPDL